MQTIQSSKPQSNVYKNNEFKLLPKWKSNLVGLALVSLAIFLTFASLTFKIHGDHFDLSVWKFKCIG